MTLDVEDVDECCGCCGLPLDQDEDDVEDEVWCAACQAHVLGDGRAFWEATYFAQHGVACPFAVDFEATVERIDTVRRIVE